MWVSVDREIQKPIQRLISSLAGNISTAKVPTENLSYFQVDQTGRMERYFGIENSISDSLGRWPANDHFDRR